MNRDTNLEEAISNIAFAGTIINKIPYGSGHINDTYCLTFKNEKVHKYILQRMNHDIFKNPKELMENISNVTSHLKKKIIANGGNPERETLNIVKANSGDSYYKDSSGNFWRAYLFIEDAMCLDSVTKPDDFYQSAVAFGQFQNLLSDFPADSLHETIINFHNTKARLEAFKQAVKEDRCGRVKDVPNEIEFVLEREKEAGLCVDLQLSGDLPLRVTHNDTKLNNVMLDNKTGKGICVIDLDTVMPGLAINDFGDSIRFGASTGAEDEKNLDKIQMDLSLFEIYVKGFLESCGDSLTAKEIEMMPWGAKLMTYECGMRFLTDYLQGDTYFKVHYDGQNLDRAHTQLKLVSDMESKWQKMQEIVLKYAN